MQTRQPEIFGGTLGRRFEFVRPLGEGGMGEVYLARDRFHEREVALKVVRAQQAAGADSRMLEHLWLNEMRLAGRLKHPYIIEIHEAGREEDLSFLVMEYLPGGTLAAFTSPESLLPAPRVADILFKLSHALEYANTQGLLHRDVKPANVLLCADGTPKISDFGAAYLSGGEHTQVIDVGTLAYVAPEHFEGAEPGLTHDIYAMGVMGYNLLSGAYPHQANTQAGIIYEKLNGEPVPLSLRRKDLPASLLSVIDRAISRDLSVRFGSWGAFREALAQAFPQLSAQSAIVSDSVRFEALRRIRFFEQFPPTCVWEAVRIGTERTFEAGEEAICAGSEDTTLYVVETGELDVLHQGVRLGRIPTGECFGEIAFIEGSDRPRSASVRATTAVTAIAFPAEALARASTELQAAAGRAIVRLLVQRLIRSNERFVAAIRAKDSKP